MAQDNSTSTFMYLDFGDWSPRYDATCFYSIQLQGYVWITSLEHLHQIQTQQQQPQWKQSDNQTTATFNDCMLSDIHLTMPRNTRLPTYYYKIIVYRGHQQTVIYRSYQQFAWLYAQLRAISSKQQQQQLPSNASFETIDIPHPLYGLQSKDECNFLSGHCWVVQQLQEFVDYLEQLRQHTKDSTATVNMTEVTLSKSGGMQYSSKFAFTRCQKLSYFLTTALQQQIPSSSTSTPPLIYANHSAARQFLEL